MTPRLTLHARQRCQEMGVRTRRVKQILRCPTMTYSSRGGQVAWSAADPGIAVVFVADGAQLLAVTVVPRTYETYRRSA